MTEAEWLATDDFFPLHSCLFRLARKRPRKYRLAGCHAYRFLCHDASNHQEAALLDLAEQYADDPDLIGLVRESCGEEGVLPLCVLDADLPFDRYDGNEAARVISFSQDRLSEKWRDQHSDVHDWLERDDADPLRKDWDAFTRQANIVGAVILRDIFGNPFRPVAFDPAWQTEAVVGIARGIYEDRAFERMPILADALQEAGCEHPGILAHCREPGVHVRGCWVVDLVLGKS